MRVTNIDFEGMGDEEANDEDEDDGVNEANAVKDWRNYINMMGPGTQKDFETCGTPLQLSLVEVENEEVIQKEMKAKKVNFAFFSMQTV